MTEDEAKTKWCPMVRVGAGPGDGLASVNKSPMLNGADPLCCIGSACMMFRTAYPMMATASREQSCYCGLAGKS